MDIPKYFNNIVLAQFKATGMPLKVYVNGQYLIIPDVYEISDPLLGSGMNPNGEMLTFDYRDIDHLLVGKNIIDLATYTKAMTGDTPEEDAKKDEEPKEESIEELTKKEQDLELKSLKLQVDAAKEAQSAAKDKMNQLKKQPTEESVNEALDGSFANAQKLLRNSTVVAYEFDRNSNGDWFVLIKYVPMNKQKVEMTVVNIGQDYSPADLNKIKREFGLDKPVRKKYRLSNPMSGGQGYGEIFENVDRPQEKKTAILNAIAKEEKRSEFQNRILNQIKRAMVDGEPLFKLPFKTQADYRRLMKKYKIPFSSKKAEKGNLRAESVNEAWIGPFVFGNTTKDDELKAMYDGALDGYANWKSGMVHPRADYKKAYQAIEKLLKRRGIQVESINELTYTTYWMGLDVRPPSYGNSELHTIAMELFGKKDFSKLSQSQKDKVVSKIPGDKKLYKTYGRGGSKKLSTESIIKKGSYVTNKDGLVGRVDNISGDKEIADIRYNDDTKDSLPIKNLKIFENNYTFGIGDIIKNKNTACPHHGSIGIVQKIMQLGADNPGKVVKYRVVNSGPTYKPGDVLSKTIDQLEPMGL